MIFFFATLIDQPEAKLWRKIILCSFVCLTWAILIFFLPPTLTTCRCRSATIYLRIRPIRSSHTWTYARSSSEKLFFDDGEEFGIVEVLIEWILQLFEISVGSFTTYIIKKYVYWKETGLLLWLALAEERERERKIVVCTFFFCTSKAFNSTRLEIWGSRKKKRSLSQNQSLAPHLLRGWNEKLLKI